MSAKLNDTTIRAWAGLMRAQQRLLERVEAELKQAALPPLGWYDVLLELHRAPGGRLRQFELGERVLLSKYNLSRLLDRLEQEGLVRREACREDRRGAHVVITREGKALVRRMWPVYESAIERYFARHLSAAEAQSLAALMQRLQEQPA